MTTWSNDTPLGRVLVLGLGGSGQAVARYCADRLSTRVTSVTVYDGGPNPSQEAIDELTWLGCQVRTGSNDVVGEYDLAVASPGISTASPLAISAALAARELIGEPEFAWRESPERWIGITGTNGKTTTTSLTAELLESAGFGAQAVGNIGTVCTSAIEARKPAGWLVAELSSYQLATSRKLHPSIACLLNVTPDHLRWHGGFDAYAQAKERIFRNMSGSDLAVVNVDDPVCAAVAERLRERAVRVCELTLEREPSGPDAAFRRGDQLVVRLAGTEYPLVTPGELLLPGEHNLYNALAASAMALEAGAGASAVRFALRHFAPLEHRIEPVAEVGGVRFVNDSKATDTDAVEKAVASFEPGSVVLLAGGHDKGTELEEFCAHIVGGLAAVVCFGDAGERFEQAFAAAAAGTDVRVLRAEHLADAFEVACEAAFPGQTVLLSPACSSFDEFSCFEERGKRFKELVSDYASRQAYAR